MLVFVPSYLLLLVATGSNALFLDLSNFPGLKSLPLDCGNVQLRRHAEISYFLRHLKGVGRLNLYIHFLKTPSTFGRSNDLQKSGVFFFVNQ
jgi:hypothetical protein